MKIKGLLHRISAMILVLTVLFTVAGCRSVKYRVDYVTSEYEVEVEDSSENVESSEETEDEDDISTPTGSFKPDSSNLSDSSNKDDSSKDDSDASGNKGNSFLSGGISTGGTVVTLEGMDNVLYTANPTFNWNELLEGQKVNILIKSTDGKVVLDKKGITGTSYKCETALANGKSYLVKVTYTDADGEETEVNSFEGEGKKMLCVASTSENDSRNYSFNGSISLEVLNNYLDRATQYTMGISSSFNPTDFDEGVRYLMNIGAKYVLRAGGEWYATNGPTNFSEDVKKKIALAHSIDPDIIFEACIFETTTSSIDNVKIPAWVFEDFGLTPEDRNFKMADTIFKDGYGINGMGLNAHIPDITTTEHQMFVYYRACQYIDMGFEALHLGQVNLIGKNDPNDEAWTKVINMIRAYAKEHARRGYVIINSHGELINSENGAMLVDMTVAPTRILAAADEVDHVVSEENPQRCDIFPGSADSVYNRNGKATSPSGWTTDKYPYLVHLDNYDDGVNGDHSKKENIWGWDETSWFIHQPAKYRREFMEFLYDKIAGYKENGHLVLIMDGGSGSGGFGGKDYYVNNPSEYCPEGSGDEEYIKAIFSRLNK